MAITKLMHTKESTSWPHAHLKNSIRYILKKEKTNDGAWVGGNAGVTTNEVFKNFLNTKYLFGKPGGRQGYHFVLSFQPGSVSEAKAYRILEEFCQEYLGDQYDYVFALHTDQPHLHGHIIFNSVSRKDGHKYHYKKGDWAKKIQPIADRICSEHGVPPLQPGHGKKGMSYGEWAWKQEGKPNWTTIIRADIDLAIQKANSFQEFESILKRAGYRIRLGHSKKHNAPYATFIFTDADGKEHRRRSYNLPAGYSLDEIQERIRTKTGPRSFEDLGNRLLEQSQPFHVSATIKYTQTYRRLYQAASYYQLPNPYAVPAGQVRGDIIRIENLLEECEYLSRNQVTSIQEAEERLALLMQQQLFLKTERNTLYGLTELMGQGQDGQPLPDGAQGLEAKIESYNTEISRIKKERKILERILETEKKHPFHIPEAQPKPNTRRP